MGTEHKGAYVGDGFIVIKIAIPLPFHGLKITSELAETIATQAANDLVKASLADFAPAKPLQVDSAAFFSKADRYKKGEFLAIENVVTDNPYWGCHEILKYT